MAKFSVQFNVHVNVQKTIHADSLQDALAKAMAIANDDPVRANLIRIPASVSYNWNDETEVTAVMS